MKVLAVLVTFFSHLPSAYADVNMMEASYRTTFIDAEVEGLSLKRRYDSRSNFSGLFGFGWCSTFDIKLDLRHSEMIECGRSRKFESVRFVNDTYVQTLPDGLTRYFDSATGRLAGLRAGSGALIRIRLPRDAALEEGLKMRLEFDDLGENVTAIRLPHGKRLRFTYSASRDLVSAENAWGNTYRFHYDALHNLVRTDFPDQTSETMTFDPDKDRLLSFEGRDGCRESYSHTIVSASRLREQVSTARLECRGHTKRIATFDFTYRLGKKRWYLERLKLTRDGQSQTINFQKQ